MRVVLSNLRRKIEQSSKFTIVLFYNTLINHFFV
jgi:hypothetical protein